MSSFRIASPQVSINGTPFFRAIDVPPDEAKQIAGDQVRQARTEKGRFEGAGRGFFRTLDWQISRNRG